MRGVHTAPKLLPWAGQRPLRGQPGAPGEGVPRDPPLLRLCTHSRKHLQSRSRSRSAGRRQVGQGTLDQVVAPLWKAVPCALMGTLFPYSPDSLHWVPGARQPETLLCPPPPQSSVGWGDESAQGPRERLSCLLLWLWCACARSNSVCHSALLQGHFLGLCLSSGFLSPLISVLSPCIKQTYLDTPRTPQATMPRGWVCPPSMLLSGSKRRDRCPSVVICKMKHKGNPSTSKSEPAYSTASLPRVPFLQQVTCACVRETPQSSLICMCLCACNYTLLLHMAYAYVSWLHICVLVCVWGGVGVGVCVWGGVGVGVASQGNNDKDCIISPTLHVRITDGW